MKRTSISVKAIGFLSACCTYACATQARVWVNATGNPVAEATLQRAMQKCAYESTMDRARELDGSGLEIVNRGGYANADEYARRNYAEAEALREQAESCMSAQGFTQR